MFSKVESFALNGVVCEKVEIEVDVARGMHKFNLVGLPDVIVREFRERAGAAIKNSGFRPPHHFGRITIFLAPSHLRKTGTGLDLAIAVSILGATEQIRPLRDKIIYWGELSLDGSLRETPGVLPVVMAAKRGGYKKIFVPAVNIREARLVKGIKIVPIKNLREYSWFLKGKRIEGEKKKLKVVGKVGSTKRQNRGFGFGQIKGQRKAKRALEIVAAGGHNLLLYGSPGMGKTLLARALPEIMPRLTFEEKLEITGVYSVAGKLSWQKFLIGERPFRDPHHTISEAALIGGGSKMFPGEITLAHRGILFLDEISEFSRKVLESLRRPMEEGRIKVARAKGSVIYPARFILVGATNPCPCGYLNDLGKECTCSPAAIARYKRKLSGPIRDRIDLMVEAGKVKFKEIQERDWERGVEIVREKVERAREIQAERFLKLGITTNAEMGLKEINRFCQLDKKSRFFLGKAVEMPGFSARAYYRTLKVARTIADLEEEKDILERHLAEAIQYQMREV